jgi:1-acyl-sn-glycerol-3-phosphate acyltransferase
MATGRAIVRTLGVAMWSIWCLAGRGSRTPVNLQRWAAGICRILGVEIVRCGPVPPPGSLMVANHLGYLDILALTAVTGPTFVAKREVQDWPVVGRLVASSGTIFISRRRPRDLHRVMEEMASATDAGRRVLWFPEATSTDGRSVLPFKSGLFEVAVSRDQPVHPVAITLAGPVGVCQRSDLCWHGDGALAPHLWRVMRTSGCRVTLVFGTGPVYRANRKALACLARDQVTENLSTVPSVRFRLEAPPSRPGGTVLSFIRV